EVLGLTWSAVDFSKKQITVRQKLVTTERKGRPEDEALVIGKPKTKKGTRSINVDSETIAHLARWKEFQAGIMGRIMPDGTALTHTPETPVCIGDNGSWLRPSSVSRWWGESNARGFRDRAGFPGLRMHELRHTQATLLLGNGVDLKTVQTRMGHAKSSHTLDLYAHAIPANDVAAANVIDAIINAPAKASATVLELSKTA
ncbi:MAG: site-specific integrase, partial [Atopobiaceae bacterium]|nr:site-specific integrase [Atopobiaceae bacterium]